MDKSSHEDNTNSNHGATDKISPRNIKKETIVLPRITEDLGSASTLRTISQLSLTENRSPSPVKGNLSDEVQNSGQFKLPTLVLPIKNDGVDAADTRNEGNIEEGFSKSKQSQIYGEELKDLKATMKQLCSEGRDLILDYRVKEDEAKKRANQEKKAARNAAKLADKETTSRATFAATVKTLSKTKGLLNSIRMKNELQELKSMNKMQINDENKDSNENIEDVVNHRDIDEDSISAIEDDDDKSFDFDYSAHSRTDRGFIKDAKKNGDHVKKKGIGKKEKRMIKVESMNTIMNDPESAEKCSTSVGVTPSDGNFEPSKGSNQVRPAKEKRKKTKTKRKKVNEKEMKENSKEDREIGRKSKENDVEDKGKNNDRSLIETKNYEDETEDSLQSLPLVGQYNIGHVEQEKNSDLESVVSTLAYRSTSRLSRSTSVAGLVQNKVKDKKWLMERFRVPKEPMEVVLHLQKCGFEYESVQLRDLAVSKQKGEANLKKAILKEKKEMKEEQKRLEKELRDRERKEAYERKIEQILAMENRKREQEEKEKEERRAKALERRKSNLELLKDINNTILSTKTSPSFRFSYVPVLPQPVASSPEPEDKSGSDISDSEEEYAPTIKRCGCQHSGRSVCATLDCKYGKYARTLKKKA